MTMSVARSTSTMQSSDGDHHRSPGSVIEMYGDELESPTTSSKTGSGYAIDGYSLYDDDATTETAKRGRFSQLLNHLGTVYSDQLESNPIRTKSLTAGTLALVGDLLAQGIELSFDNTGEDSTGLDGWRVFAMFIEGLCFSGPSMHYAYEFYEHLFPIVRCDCVEPIVHEDVQILDSKGNVIRVADFKTQWKNVVIHVAFDQIFMAMWYVAGLMIVTCVIEGHSDDVLNELQNDYFRNLGASYLAAALFFAPVQIYAFGKLEKSYRVLAVNTIDILWVTVMSIVTHLNRGESESFIKSVLIPMLSMIGENIVYST
ncbi:hypothetical protein ACHAWT_007023 [Skeletonema menzelii]